MVRIDMPTEALKAEDFEAGTKVIEKAEIKSVEQKETEFGKRFLITLEDTEDEEEKAVFLNKESQKNLVKAYGSDGDDWNTKLVSVICEKGKGKYKNKMLIVKPLK